MSTITLSGINEALDKHSKDGAESKGIKAHFAMDESGILNLVNVELVSEKSSSAPDEEEGTFSILGSTISKLFAGLCKMHCKKCYNLFSFCSFPFDKCL